MSRLIIHAGSHKTGTTSIQTYLDQIRPKLPEWGYEYPDLPQNFRHRISHFVILRYFFAIDPAKRAEAEAFLTRANASAQDVILSAESLFGLPPQLPGEDSDRYWRRKLRRLTAMRGFFPDREARIVLYLRDPQAYMVSLFRQAMRVSREPAASMDEAIETFLTRNGHAADYHSQVETWRRAFGAVTVVDYDQLPNRSSVARFCEILGIPAPAEEVRENTSPDGAAVELRRIAMRNGDETREPHLAEAERARLNDEIAAMVKTRIARFLSDSAFKPVAAEPVA